MDEVTKYANHGEEMLNCINELREESSLSDVTVIMEGRKFHTHKVVLCAASGYFKAMFTSGFQESDKTEVTVDGDAGIFERILEFIYSGQLRINDDILPDIIQMASYFQFTHALAVCERFLQKRFRDKTIDFETVVHVSGAYGPLGNVAEDYIASNFLEFSKLPSFNETPLDLLETLLDRNDLTALSQKIEEKDVSY